MIEFFTIILSFLVLFNIFKESKKNVFLLCLIVLIFIIFDGLRWETGTDWENYKESFDNALDLDFSFEFGYTIYIYLFRLLINNYSVFLLTTSLLFYSIIFYKVFLFSNKSFFSILYLIGTLPWYSGAIRQMLSLIFFLFAIEQCLKRKFIKFFIFVIFGISFHTLMFLNLFLYMIYDISLAGFILFSLVILFLLFSFKSYLIQIQQILEIIRPEKNYERYLSGGSADSGSNNFLLGFLRKIYTYTFLFFFSKKNFKQNSNVNKKFNFFFMLSLFSILSYVIGTFLIAGFSSRADIYYGLISTSVYIGLVEKKINNVGIKILLFIFVISLLLINYSRLEYLDLFHPYKSIFYNQNYFRDLY